MIRCSLVFLSLLALPFSAFAADPGDAVAWGDDDKKPPPADEDDIPAGQDDDEKKPPTKRIEEADDEIPLDDDDAVGPAGETGDDILGNDVAGDKIGGPGEDTASIYRAAVERYANSPPDEEIIRWEAYVEKYPKTLFQDRIDKRIEELQELQFAERINEGDGRLDADAREITFSQSLGLPNINPRTRLSVGLGWGIPNYVSPQALYEQAFNRQFSAHVALGAGYFGGQFNLGAKYALVKSSRLQLIVTGMLDLSLSINPFYPAIKPGIAVGKKFGVFDLMAIGGVELDPRKQAGVRGWGGFVGTYRASDAVRVFAETTLYMQSVPGETDPLAFRFNTFNFGLKFMPTIKGLQPEALEINLGAAAPYTTSYWRFHEGSVLLQGTLYL